ncbi:MAG: N-acetylmuramoyl-L-alanine amidase family protein [Nocardioides sp.]
MNVRQQLVTGSKNTGSGVNARRWITIHETANTSRGANAAAHARLQSGGNVRVASWHWQVDDAEAVQSFPHSTVCWHAGTAAGNGQSVGIEICVNADGDYLAAVRNAATLTAQIMRDEAIPLERVVDHNHWSGKNCPTLLRGGASGITWAGFLELVRAATGQSVAPKPAPQPAPAPALEEDDDMLDRLNALYLRRLGRKVDASGFATFGSALILGTKTWAQVDAELAASGEGQAFARLTPAQQDARRGAAGI